MQECNDCDYFPFSCQCSFLISSRHNVLVLRMHVVSEVLKKITLSYYSAAAVSETTKKVKHPEACQAVNERPSPTSPPSGTPPLSGSLLRLELRSACREAEGSPGSPQRTRLNHTITSFLLSNPLKQAALHICQTKKTQSEQSSEPGRGLPTSLSDPIAVIKMKVEPEHYQKSRVYLIRKITSTHTHTPTHTDSRPRT